VERRDACTTTLSCPVASASDFPHFVWFQANDMDCNHTSRRTLSTGLHCNEHSNDISEWYRCRRGAASPDCTGV